MTDTSLTWELDGQSVPMDNQIALVDIHAKLDAEGEAIGRAQSADQIAKRLKGSLLPLLRRMVRAMGVKFEVLESNVEGLMEQSEGEGGEAQFSDEDLELLSAYVRDSGAVLKAALEQAPQGAARQQLVALLERAATCAAILEGDDEDDGDEDDAGEGEGEAAEGATGDGTEGA